MSMSFTLAYSNLRDHKELTHKKKKRGWIPIDRINILFYDNIFTQSGP